MVQSDDYGGGSGKMQALYGVHIYGQVKNIVDDANKRHSEIPAEHKGPVSEALKHLEEALKKLHPYSK